ncbi:MAG: cytochrome c [Epsilonproteobacteria bacterium]|nr:cytochrome c [Campylobacterota bacterium]
MKQLFLTAVIVLAVSGAEDSFITKEEYAQMLYQNPRGIGCHKCHGLNGRGKILGRFNDGNSTKVIEAPDITNLDFKRFKSALLSAKSSLMPHYFLTNKEIKTLYYYLQRKKRDE